MNKHVFESSQRDSQNQMSESSTVSVPEGTSVLRAPEDLARLRWLASRPDSVIDFSDIPRLTPEEYESAKRYIAERRMAKLRKAS